MPASPTGGSTSTRTRCSKRRASRKQKTNDQILTRLRAAADSLGLPEEAGMISIRRTADSISIEADYDEHVELPMYVKAIHYRPRAVGPL